MQAGKIAPSIMCADFRRLEETLAAFKSQVDYLHIDIMDGRFVPNFTLGPDIVKQIRDISGLPIDLHLMTEQPEYHISLFPLGPGDLVSIHQEACRHLQRTLQSIKETGAKASVALNPATPIYVLEDVLEDIDAVLIMTVNPGFAGQKLIPQTLKKIAHLRTYLDERGYRGIEIEVDGNVSFTNARLMKDAGAQIFVAGTSSIFQKGGDLGILVEQFKQCIS